jgi:phosphoribosylformylglycinamidine synthase
MKAWEILLSESQERMLIVCHKGKEAGLLEVFDKWDIACAQIGEVTEGGQLEFLHHGELVASIPAESLVLGGGAPVYVREYVKPKYLEKIQRFKLSSVPKPANFIESARKLWASPNLVSKRWIYEQYDSMVRTNTVTTNMPSDAAVVRIKGTSCALALTTDCNPAYVYADPYIGAMIAVAEAARNIVCSGGLPLAITNCLNFGNPHNPEVYWQFVHAIRGMGEACRKLDTPVTGGNVSFYNQSVLKDRTEPVFPTPTIGMVGLLKDLDNHMTLHFKSEGDFIYMLGTPHNDLGSSEYLRHICKIPHSPIPAFDMEEELLVQHAVMQLIAKKLVVSAHDISDGGLFAALMECATNGQKGFDAETDLNFRKDAYWFGESQSRVIVSLKPQREDEFLNYLNVHNVPFSKIGEVKGANIWIDAEDLGPVGEWAAVHEETLGEKMAFAE